MLALAALAALLAGAAGFGLGWGLHKPVLSARAYAQNRLIAVQVHLDEAPPDYVFLAGDSQAELQPPAQRPCGLELVNGGVSGSSAAVYADLVETLSFRGRPRAVMLTIGTNDLMRKNSPLDPKAAAQFEAAATRIVRRLMQVTDTLVVTALPPVGRDLERVLEPGAVGAYSERLRALCERLGCRFADPFAALRDGGSGLATPGALRDGLHLAAYRPALLALAPALCRTAPH
ncbi:SGNH/GDSL hydrolase family protein [Methylobacterium planeticum]|uniref:SGNH/GDSL hydrolase family protein n=1 Tax=Methylobacterium planeticum TaxID=2615211 RepID=A0A6N6MJM3_9HYPH|nr:SGNH/GDSL hydrolase family protein [Methylobacterium planeticum]